MKFFNKQSLINWYSAAGIIGILFGIFYAFFGLESLPVYNKFVPDDAYLSWFNGLYGSTFIGYSVLLFFFGRYAFQKNDKTLMKALLYGINAWLIIEGFFSLIYGIYINVGVDIVLWMALGLPLVNKLRSSDVNK